MPSRSERVIEELRAQLKLADEVNFKLRHNLSQQLRADERIWTDGGVNSGRTKTETTPIKEQA